MENAKIRNYTNLRGVDYSNRDVKTYRSPNCINMWKVNDVIETRPGMTLMADFGLQIYGFYFFDIDVSGTITTKVIVHAGTKLFQWDNYPTVPILTGDDATVTTLFTGMNLVESQAFVFNNIFFIKDGINYLEYDGSTCEAVVGTIPITANSRTPDGETITDDDDLILQDVNLLQAKRYNQFIGDGTSTEYYLDTTGLDSASVYLMTATVNGSTLIENIDFTVNRTTGVVTFNTAPAAPSDDGDSNVIITLSKTVSGYADRIKKCTLASSFDSRIFFAGNQDYPSTLFHSELEDPRYVRDTAYYEEGLDFAEIKALVPGNSAIWVFKEPSQNNTTVFYHKPTIDYTYGKIYPKEVSKISTGCVSTGVNFGDDIVFFSNFGMEAINGDLDSELLLSHRSTLVDKKITAETNYDKLKIAEYKNYLMCLVDNNIYLVDRQQTYTNEESSQTEYEWYYWEMPNEITYIKELKNEVYMGNADGKIYKLDGTTDNGVAITSKWTTPSDDFDTASLLKTSNKRGGVANVKIVTDGTITVKASIDGEDFTTIGTYSVANGYIVYNIKKKKWKEIQIEFSSSNFGLYDATLQAFLGGYCKR